MCDQSPGLCRRLQALKAAQRDQQGEVIIGEDVAAIEAKHQLDCPTPVATSGSATASSAMAFFTVCLYGVVTARPWPMALGLHDSVNQYDDASNNRCQVYQAGDKKMRGFAPAEIPLANLPGAGAQMC